MYKDKRMAFETTGNNAPYEQQANIPGKFRLADGAPDYCPMGLIVEQKELTDSEGYRNLKNGNNWWFELATSTAREIYFCNSYNPAEIESPASGQVFQIDKSTFNVGIAAGRDGTFTLAVSGMHYVFAMDNFATPITWGTHEFATIGENGLFIPITSEPTVGRYVQILREKRFVTGPFRGDTGAHVRFWSK